MGGRAYVYLIYGMHCCFNVVANGEGKPEAVLVRALEPVCGLDLMRANRGRVREAELCSGPGRLCREMGITRADNGADLLGDGLFIPDYHEVPDEDIEASPRINVGYAGEAALYPWKPCPLITYSGMRRSTRTPSLRLQGIRTSHPPPRLC